MKNQVLEQIEKFNRENGSNFSLTFHETNPHRCYLYGSYASISHSGQRFAVKAVMNYLHSLNEVVVFDENFENVYEEFDPELVDDDFEPAIVSRNSQPFFITKKFALAKTNKSPKNVEPYLLHMHLSHDHYAAHFNLEGKEAVLDFVEKNKELPNASIMRIDKVAAGYNRLKRATSWTWVPVSKANVAEIFAHNEKMLSND